MPKKQNSMTFQRVAVTFTPKQIEFIDDLVKSGELGGSRAEVIKQAFLFYLRDRGKGV